MAKTFSRVKTLALLLGCLFLAAIPASARERCDEGRTRDGQCVNAEAAEMGRKDALLATQAKLSMTAPAVMPGDPDSGRYGYNYAEIKAFFIDRLSRHGLAASSSSNTTSSTSATTTPVCVAARCP